MFNNMQKKDYIEDAQHPDKPESGYIDHSKPSVKPKKLPWWKILWNWIKSLFG